MYPYFYYAIIFSFKVFLMKSQKIFVNTTCVLNGRKISIVYMSIIQIYCNNMQKMVSHKTVNCTLLLILLLLPYYHPSNDCLLMNRKNIFNFLPNEIFDTYVYHYMVHFENRLRYSQKKLSARFTFNFSGLIKF